MSDFRPDSLLILEAHDAVLRDKRASMKPNEFICGICERVSEEDEAVLLRGRLRERTHSLQRCFLFYVEVVGHARVMAQALPQRPLDSVKGYLRAASQGYGLGVQSFSQRRAQQESEGNAKLSIGVEL